MRIGNEWGLKESIAIIFTNQGPSIFVVVNSIGSINIKIKTVGLNCQYHCHLGFNCYMPFICCNRTSLNLWIIITHDDIFFMTLCNDSLTFKLLCYWLISTWVRYDRMDVSCGFYYICKNKLWLKRVTWPANRSFVFFLMIL